MHETLGSVFNTDEGGREEEREGEREKKKKKTNFKLSVRASEHSQIQIWDSLEKAMIYKIQ